MALDAQRNWTVSMAENLEAVKRRSGRSGTLPHLESSIADLTLAERHKPWEGDPIYLPDEILHLIVEYLPLRQSPPALQHTLAACCLLSRQWYAVAVPFLYDQPYLYGPNYDPFMRTICPSINLHVRASPLADLVRVLDLSKLVHQGSKSLTARLLGRTKKRLQEFIAPQASFAVNCLPALSKCHHLRLLDLSLVSESPPLPDLFKTVSHLVHLRTFRLPRSSGFGSNGPSPASHTLPWPPALEDINLSGGIDAHFIHGIVAFPHTLRRLTIERCPQAKGFAIKYLLRTTVRPLPLLAELRIAHLPRLRGNALDDVLFLLPGLRKLSISVDYITGSLFDFDSAARLQLLHDDSAAFPSSFTATPPLHPDSPCTSPPLQSHLQILELTNSGNPGDEDKLTPIDVLMPIDDATLPHLRQVWVASSLRWCSKDLEPDVEALAEALVRNSNLAGRCISAAAISEGAPLSPSIDGLKPGVWEFTDVA